MKELSGRAATKLDVPPERCIALLAAIERYPDWYPDVIRRAEVLERDAAGAPTRATATVHVAIGPVARDFDLRLEVQVDAHSVRLARIPHQATDEEEFEMRWEAGHGSPTELSVTLRARLDVPRFLPLGDAGESVAQGFVEAARRVLEDSKPKASASSS